MFEMFISIITGFKSDIFLRRQKFFCQLSVAYNIAATVQWSVKPFKSRDTNNLFVLYMRGAILAFFLILNNNNIIRPTYCDFNADTNSNRDNDTELIVKMSYQSDQTPQQMSPLVI